MTFHRTRPVPAARRSDHTDTYHPGSEHGRTVADPYRWLEDAHSSETRAFVDAQNELTRSVLDALPLRQKLLERLGELWNYARRGAVWQQGGKYFQLRNSGLQNQFVLYVMDTPDAEGRVLLDPNTFSEDGTVSLGGLSVSPDAARLAYAVSQGGSDWLEWRVREIESVQDLGTRLTDSKFSGANWLPDSSGFFYGRYDRPPQGEQLSGANFHQRLWLHRLGDGKRATSSSPSARINRNGASGPRSARTARIWWSTSGKAPARKT